MPACDLMDFVQNLIRNVKLLEIAQYWLRLEPVGIGLASKLAWWVSARFSFFVWFPSVNNAGATANSFVNASPQ